ncbi:tRNA lysidine(34) synthetase TilS [Pelagibacterium lacus]|uniref:tRNA(Ile)-lysidine synthase n=1 Tax=Pelagibacterium lacus TaxID=2282655 RepID=A0A369W291_9HYPH|nr:tRNA lysidine(34) synthetase TilS [Pelagibacterium lacus]RDE08149.1 tRNA lysidine(34) synthetase TilS [Pelagibacterium lacus]
MLDPARIFAPIRRETSIALAVSGGADSLALMLLFAEWAPAEGKPRAVVYTVDHRLRPEAAEEAAMVAREAERLGLEARILVWDAPKPATGRQAAAREARYRLMGEAMAQDGSTLLLTAHHRRDQAETVLMRLAHGSGVAGLAGMAPFAEVEAVALFRPLLDTDPDALAALVEHAGLVPARDPSNFDRAYERTRWRDILPDLGRLGLTDARLAQFAGRMARIEAQAQSAARQFIAAHCHVDFLGVAHIAREAFGAADAETAIRALAVAIAAASGQDLRALAPVEAMAARLRNEPGTALTLGGAVIAPRADAILVYREAGRMDAGSLLLTPGQSGRWDNRFTVTAPARAVTVTPAALLTRERFEDLLAQPLAVPVAALHAAPVVRAEDGAILAIGSHVFEAGLSIAGPMLTAWH